MKENGVIRRRLSGKEADPYIGLARKILGEMKNIMRLGGIKQLNWTKDFQNGVRIMVSSIFGQDEINISVPLYVPLLTTEEKEESFTSSIFKITGSYMLGGVRQAFIWSDGVMKVIATGFQPHNISMDGETTIGLRSTVSGALKWTEAEGLTVLNAPGFAGGWATSVAWDGSIIGGFGRGVGQDFQAYRWDNEGAATSLGVGTYSESQAWGMSADGTVIVGHTSHPTTFDTQAFYWTADEGMVALGKTHSGDSYARRCSSDGSVIVGYAYSYTDVIYGAEACYWDMATGIHYLGAMPGHYTSRANDISADGRVIVGYSEPDDGYRKAFKWTSATGMVALETPAGSTTVARAVTADGTLICGDVVYDSGLNIPCYWDEQGKFKPITLPSGGSSGGAVGITNARFDKNNNMIFP